MILIIILSILRKILSQSKTHFYISSNLNMLEFFFFSAFIPAFLTLRIDLDNSGLSDYQNNLLSLTCYGDWDLSNIVYCPDNTWAYGFSLVDSQDYGVLNIVLDCRGQKYDTNTSMWSVTTSQVVQYSNLGIFSGISLRKTDFVYCNGDSGHDFIRGSKVRMWCPSNIDYAQGIVEVKIRCSYYDSITTSLKTTNPAAAYTANYSTCKAGYVACGYEIRYNPYEQTIHFGAIDIRFQCCKICEESQGFYMTAGRICAYCDISCLQCSESATHCTKCPSGFTLNADNTCTTNIVRTLVFSEFFDPFSTDSNLQTTCGPYVLIGGYNVFGKSHWFEKSMTGLAVHNTVEIRVNFYKIGTWPDGSGRIWIDSVLQKTLHATQLERPIYYSSDCGFNNYLQNVFKVVLLLSHDASSISIKFDINSTGDNAFWAINRFQLITYSKCDVTCNDCTGPLFTQCTSCTFPRFLTIANTCEITCNTPYFAYLTTWTCVITCPFPNYGNPIDRTCDEVCPDNYYMNDGDRQCYSVCRNNTYGNPLNGKCDTMCPSEMYKDTTTNLCLLCEYNCATCTSSSTNCESCTFSWLEALPNCENPTCKIKCLFFKL